MKRVSIGVMGVAAVVGALLAGGCEWSTSRDDVGSWNDSYNWVNFSGTYRNTSGGMLVTDYTTTPSTPGSTNTVNVSNAAGGTLPRGATMISGSSHASLVPGSLVVSIGGDAVLQDDGNGVLSGTGGSGTVSSLAGTWTANVDSADRERDRPVKLSYAYTVSNSGTAASGAKSGASGKAIYSFVLSQQGQNLTITDNNGAKYTGRISSMRSASGKSSSETMPMDGDTIVASFSCSGRSAAGMSVTITGTLQGTVAAGVFTGRTLQGTWIEAGGKTGDINANTTGVAIPTASAEEAPAAE